MDSIYSYNISIFQALNKQQKLNQNKTSFSLSFFIIFNHLSIV